MVSKDRGGIWIQLGSFQVVLCLFPIRASACLCETINGVTMSTVFQTLCTEHLEDIRQITSLHLQSEGIPLSFNAQLCNFSCLMTGSPVFSSSLSSRSIAHLGCTSFPWAWLLTTAPLHWMSFLTQKPAFLILLCRYLPPCPKCAHSPYP